MVSRLPTRLEPERRSQDMACAHFDAARCRSCGWLDRTYSEQLRAKEAQAREQLGRWPDVVWEPPVASGLQGFRNKAKMVVSGPVDAVTLGIVDGEGVGIDLRDCPIQEPAILEAMPVLAELITRARVEPYDVSTRRGEIKHLLVTASPDGELMVRFVLRSQEAVSRLRKHLAWLTERLGNLAVASVNLQPEHKAVLEGSEEIPLSENQSLRMGLDVDLHLQPQSFFQTNTAIARQLYRTGREWVERCVPTTVWDLYCGVGGFALHVAGPHREVLGIEVSEAAVRSARRSATEADVPARFEVGDAASVGEDRPAPDLVIVNPPRRGIGELASWLERSRVRSVVYSSCNAVTLASDLEVMESWTPVRARVMDMFPHTAHYEVITLLQRR